MNVLYFNTINLKKMSYFVCVFYFLLLHIGLIYDIIFIGDRMSTGCIYNIDLKTSNNETISVSSDYFDHFFIANLDEDGDETVYKAINNSTDLGANFFMIKILDDLAKESQTLYKRLISKKDIVKISLSFTNGKRQEFEIPKKRIANNGVMENKFEEILELTDGFGIIVTDKNLKYKKELFI